MKYIGYSRGNPAGRAKRIEWLYKRIHRRVRQLEKESEGKNLAEKIRLHGLRKCVEKHQPRLKMLWQCYMWLAEQKEGA